MSAQTHSVSQRRIVNTSSSGVVTIVIDDDNGSEVLPKQCVNASVTPSAVASRSASLVSVQTPKFIRTDVSSHSSMVSSNDKKLIVVKKTSHSANGELCPSLSCSLSSQSSQSRAFVSPQHKPHNSMKQCASMSNYVMVSKSQTHSHSMASSMQSASVSVSSPQSSHSHSSSQVSKTSPHKYRLWNQQSVSSSNSSNNNNNSNNFGNSYSRYSSQSSDQQSRGQLKEKVLPPEDTESDCMDDETYFKYLNLISNNAINDNKSKHELCSKWPLRNIAKGSVPNVCNGSIVLPNLKIIKSMVASTPDLTQQFHERKHRWYKEAQQYNERLNRFKANMPLNNAMKEKLQTDLEILHKNLMLEKSQLSEEEERYRNVKQCEQRRKMQNEEQEQELEEYMTELEFGSPLGQRVLNSTIDNGLSPPLLVKKIQTYEHYCLPSKEVSTLNVPQTKLTTRLTRSNTGFAGVDKMWGPRGYSHEYCFSREQRLEKYMRLNTGLDWKSRLLSLQCKSVNVGLEKITRCPCCLELVEPEWGHSCRDFDSESVKMDDEPNDEHSHNDMQVDECEDYSMDSEIIIAGMTCWKCGSDECTGDMCSSDNSPVKVANRIDNPILVFTTKDTILPLKHVVDDKIMVQQVKSCLYKTVQQKSDSEPKLRYIDNNENRDVCDDNDDDDDDIVIIQEVRSCSQQKNPNTNIDNKIINSSPIIMRYSTESSEKSPLIKRYCESSPIIHRSPKGSAKSTDVIVVKKI